MNDIADELRAFEGSEALANGDFSVCCRGAAEITRLRARVAELETALQFIKDAPAPNWNNMGSYEAGLRYCAGFARAALEGGKDE